MKHTIIFAAVIAAGTAYADTKPDYRPAIIDNYTQVNKAQSTSISRSKAVSRSDSTASVGDVNQTQAQIGGSQVMTVNESDRKYTYDRYTPSVVAPSIGTSIPCHVPVSAGVGVPGVSVSGGTAYLDKGCEARENVRIGLESDVPLLRDWSIRIHALTLQQTYQRMISDAADKAKQCQKVYDWQTCK